MHVDLWNAKAGSLDGPTPSAVDEPSDGDDELERTLRTRLSALIPRLRRG